MKAANEAKICLSKYSNYTKTADTCQPIFDGILCWEPTPSGTNISQPCPLRKGLDISKFAWRYCNENGYWNNSNRSNLEDKGYTNYNDCYNPQMKELLELCNKIGLEDCFKIANRSRIIEMVGLCISLISLLISLYIFYRYRILRNNRTTIHKNLFLATVFQVIVRLTIYPGESSEHFWLENVPYLCESMRILLELSKIASIMWMFIEGLYLHNAITVTVFQEHSYIKIYCYVGWFIPISLTLIWLVTMLYSAVDKCWYLYNFLPNYWILEGPSSALIIVNILFLLNIIRILVMKLRDSNIGEIEKVKKAVRAAIFLVPLMGTTNILFMIDYRLFKDSNKFALWSYTTSFFTSFQGFLIATLYCFMNGEVRDAVKNSVCRYFYLRQCIANTKHSTEDTGLSTAEPEQ